MTKYVAMRPSTAAEVEHLIAERRGRGIDREAARYPQPRPVVPGGGAGRLEVFSNLNVETLDTLESWVGVPMQEAFKPGGGTVAGQLFAANFTTSNVLTAQKAFKFGVYGLMRTTPYVPSASAFARLGRYRSGLRLEALPPGDNAGVLPGEFWAEHVFEPFDAEQPVEMHHQTVFGGYGFADAGDRWSVEAAYSHGIYAPAIDSVNVLSVVLFVWEAA